MSVIVFGATGSVGRAVAQSLHQQRKPFWLVGRNATALKSLADQFETGFSVAAADDVPAIEAAFAAAQQAIGTLRGAVNCMGSVLLKPAHLTSDEEWRSTISINLDSSFTILRSAAKAMRGEGGSIVLIASAAAQLGIANHEAIAAAKGGIIAMARSAAASYANQRIRVNVVSPGLVKSEMTRRLWEVPASADTSIKMHALGRLGEPQDVAEAILWLLSDASSWVTGQTIGVDGGLGSILPRPRG
jgi:3-oxoacyl-[acyl-carrier protein] reductase